LAIAAAGLEHQANRPMVDVFGADLYQAILDPYRETADLGADIESPEDGLPICRVSLVQTEADVRNLRLVAPEDGRRMFDRLEGINETAPKKSKIPRPASQDFFSSESNQAHPVTTSVSNQIWIRLARTIADLHKEP
jgi:hypothetical protein